MQNLVHKQNEETRNLMSMLAHKLELHRPKRKQFAVTLGIISVAAFASLSIFATGPNAEPEANVEKAWPVSTMAVKKDNLAPSFSAFGRLEATQTANIRSDVVSRIVAVHVKEGDWVEAGEHLVQLDDRETKLRVLERQAELKQHQANLASAQSQFELVKANAAPFQSRYEVAQAKLTRHQNLMKKRLISKSLLDEVMSQANTASIEYQNHQREITNLPLQIAAHDANVARADALLQQAQLDLEKTKIVAPFSGPILSVMVAPGDHSNLSVPLVSLANIDSFEVRVQVPNNYARQFQNSQRNYNQSNNFGIENFISSPKNLMSLATQRQGGQKGQYSNL